jgi:hypothetical protein
VLVSAPGFRGGAIPPGVVPTFRVDETIRYDYEAGELHVLVDGVVREAMHVRTALVEGVLLEGIVAELRHRGYLVEPPGGDRAVVEATVEVSGELWRREPEVRARARRDVRRRWALELEVQGRRPLGWPPVEVYPVRFAELSSRPPDGPFEPADEASADRVLVRVSCEAVPA